jgi:hypothetical protein
MDDRQTGNQIRATLARRDPPINVSHGQMEDWRDWGLLHQDASLLWDGNTVSKIIRIHDVGKSVDAIARRVILLSAETSRTIPPAPGRESDGERSEWFFQVPPESLRRAMLEVAPKIRPHLKKMRRIAAAVSAMPSASGNARSGTRRQQSSADSLPRSDEWEAVLSEASTQEFAQRSGLQYYVAALLGELGRRGGVDVSDSPVEEQIVLLTVRDLYWRRELRRQKSSSQTGEAE